METYDLAHKLARALTESDEYKEFVKAKAKVEEDENNVKMLRDFRTKQLEVQMAQATGQEVPEEQVEQLERMYQMLSLNNNINEYLTAEYRLSRLMADIQKILGDAVKEWFDLGEGETNLN